MYPVYYIGNVARVAEYIYYNDDFDLKGIICESERVTDDIFTLSLIRDIKLYSIKTVEELEVIMAKNVDNIFICCSFVQRIPMEKYPYNKVFNIHFAELPGYKGRHADYWSVMEGEKYLGVSLHVMNEKFDDGDIIALEKVPYYFWENHISMNQEQCKTIPYLLNALCSFLRTGEILCKNQPGGYFRAITNKDKEIDLENDSPADIFNKVRTQAIYRGAKVNLDSDSFYLKDCCFKSKKIDKSYMIEGNNLYIRYKSNIVIYSTNYYFGYE